MCYAPEVYVREWYESVSVLIMYHYFIYLYVLLLVFCLVGIFVQ